MIAVLFEARTQPEQHARYLELAAQLKSQLSNLPGFISVERFSSLTETGKTLSLSYWENEEAVLAWKNNVQHQQAQHEGRAGLFSYYQIRIATVTREYEHEAIQHV
ncbi:antibiotic biosynthesis monooxygenase [Erwinia sp. S63]|uniref:antibiotic biosynthesis monooxygenase family protein n=1 Tax=Erwinia sp. S63 TaxID=2769341 RepID=UPI00190B9A69|nr:antibiotic biosynthesis monooxygenase [Erwinia sp. S63]MBK0097303.1 antibiotic biosynthesis monooxygenase [Erwinia sp. S63]